MDDQEPGEAGLMYRTSAQIFLHELLGLKEGRACLRVMLSELPNYFNWQLAFLKAFRAHFQRPVEVEKWWALQVVHFSTRDALAQTWPFEESSQKLDQTLHASVELHTGTNQLPLTAEVPLQQVLREWDRPRQAETLQLKMRELQLLRVRVSDEFVPLADKYRQLLENYLQHQQKPGIHPFRRRAHAERLAAETVQALDQLDALRAAVRPIQKPVVARKP